MFAHYLPQTSRTWTLVVFAAVFGLLFTHAVLYPTLPQSLTVPIMHHIRKPFGGYNQKLLHYELPDPAVRASALIDTYADFADAAECGINSLSLHMPFEPLCPDKKSVLEAMSNGGRPGYDMPYIPQGCDMRWYDTPEACAVLDKFSHVFIIGDSLQRHLTNALYAVLRQDMGYGGITDWDFQPEQTYADDEENGIHRMTELEECKCGKYVTHHPCSNQAISNSDWLRGNGTALKLRSPLRCSADMAKVTYHKLLSYPISDEELWDLTVDLRDARPDKPVAFIMHHAHWNDVNVTATDLWLNQIIDHVQYTAPRTFRPGAWLPRLFVTSNAGGLTKGIGFLATQGNHMLAKFERAIMPRLEAKGVDGLGMFNMSVQSTQWDGLHTTLDTNLLKVNMVLNWLDNLEVERWHTETALALA